MNVYADNAATTRMSQAAVDAMLPFLRESYGNPSSLYTLGQKAAESLQASRETMAKYLGCDAREITFTSGGSEADNQALLTAATLGARKGIFLTNLIEGGAQERGKRAGTENVGGIAGMAAAFREACEHMDENIAKVTALRDKLIDGLSKIPHCALNGDREHRLPGNVNFCFEGIEGESMLLLLDGKGICASSGSACTSGSLDPSHVLLAIGRPHEVAHGSLRLTLCESNTEAEIDHILACVPEIVAYLRGMSPVWRDLVEGKKSFIL